MRDVAKLAGVTQPTVSYVINNTASISDEVRDKVNRAIAELSYKPNYFARGLKTNKSNMIGVVIPDITNEYYAIMVNRIERLLLHEHFGIVIQSTNYRASLEEKGLRNLIDYNVDGIIMTYQPVGKDSCNILLNHGAPTVILEGGSSCADIPCINTDNHLGGYTAARYLLDQGRRKVAYVGQKVKNDALKERCNGFLSAMREFGIDGLDYVMETQGPANKWYEGVQLGKQLLKMPLDGLIVSSDIVAVGIIKQLLTSGIQIPQQIAVVGYDDIPIAELFAPSLTTVTQPLEKMCTLAIEKLMLAMQGKPVTGELLRPKLVRRESA